MPRPLQSTHSLANPAHEGVVLGNDLHPGLLSSKSVLETTELSPGAGYGKPRPALQPFLLEKRRKVGARDRSQIDAGQMTVQAIRNELRPFEMVLDEIGKRRG